MSSPQDPFIHSPVKNDALLQSMKRLRGSSSSPEDGNDKSDKNDKNDLMLEVLKNAAAATLVVPVDVGSGEGSSSYSFNAVGDKKGRRFMVVFSDTESFEIGKHADDQNAVTASFEDVMRVCLDTRFKLDGMIINPGAEEVIFGNEILGRILGQMAPGKEDAGSEAGGAGSDVCSDGNAGDGRGFTELKTGMPDKFPPQMLQMVKEFASNEPSIEEVYVLLFVEPVSDARGWFFVLKSSLEGGSREYVYDTFKRFMNPYLDGLQCFVFDIGEDFASAAVAPYEPVYVRG